MNDFYCSLYFSQVVFLFSLCIIRFPTANGGTISNKQGGNDIITIPLGNLSAITAPTSSLQASNITLNATGVAPTGGSLNDGSIYATHKTTNLDPSAAMKSTRKPKRTVKRMSKKASRSRRWTKTRKSMKHGVAQSGRGFAIQNSTNYVAKNTTSEQTNILKRSHLSRSKKVHPCNTVQTSAMNYSVGSIVCRRWKSSELQHHMSCLGSYSHRYLASSFKEAQHFKDLDTGRVQDLSSSHIWNHSKHRVQKRYVNINPGETLISRCHARKTTTESGHLRICPTCAAITRQPVTPKRFPEYINELLCDPKMVSNYLPGIDGFCVQKTFTLDLLQFTGEWELDTVLSAEAGFNVYKEKWEIYTQRIRRHCACELLASSPMANFL